MGSNGSRIRTLAEIAAMTAILEAAKFALNAIPNVELVTLLVIVFTRHFGWKKTLPAVLLFALLECMWWGFGTWSAVYFYMWPLLVLLTHLVRKEESVWVFAMLAGFFGLFFGAFSALATVVLFGFRTAFAWWISGIPYDLIHGAANFLICLLLYKPLMRALTEIRHNR